MSRLLNIRHFPDCAFIAAMDARIPEINALLKGWAEILHAVFPDGFEGWTKDRSNDRRRIPGAIPRPLHMRNGWS